MKKNTKVIGDYIAHVRRQNSDLALQLENLNKSYVLNHQEIENNHQYDQQIATIEKQYADQTKAIQEGTAVFSSINHAQQKMMKDLGQIESLQKDLFQSTVQLHQREKEARSSLAKFDLEMRNKKNDGLIIVIYLG